MHKALDGDASSATELGEMYAHGSNAPHDVPEAMRWLTRGAELGSNVARRELGLLLARGEGTSKDLDHAAVLLRQAAEAGDAEAEAALGVMYAYGDGVPQNWALAVDWSRKAAEQNNPWGQANYRIVPGIGTCGPADPSQAADWYRKAADGRVLRWAQVRLGLLYQKGSGVELDLSSSLRSLSSGRAGQRSDRRNAFSRLLSEMAWARCRIRRKLLLGCNVPPGTVMPRRCTCSRKPMPDGLGVPVTLRWRAGTCARLPNTDMHWLLHRLGNT